MFSGDSRKASLVLCWVKSAKDEGDGFQGDLKEGGKDTLGLSILRLAAAQASAKVLITLFISIATIHQE